jgi:hypothetical protein
MGICVVVLIVFAFVEATHDGDLVGYITAGESVLLGRNIYLDYLNTWPPFFSVMAAPLAWAYSFAPYLVKLIWILGSLAALFISFKLIFKLFFRKILCLPFQKSDKENDLAFHHPIVVIPLLLVLRMIIEHNSHLQINLYMMLLAIGSMYFYYKGKPEWAGLLLGVSIALKVYTVLILFFFLYKQAYKVVLYSLLTLAICIASTAFVFGIDRFGYYHELWWIKNSVPRKPATHMNQGLLATVLRYISGEDPEMDVQVNLLNLSFTWARRVFYGLVFAIALYPAWLFKKKLQAKDLSLGVAIQWSIIFSAIPLLSPVGWKYYYVFMWLPYLLIYYVLFYRKLLGNSPAEKWLKILFYFSIVGLTLSSELFLGPWLSDVFEVLGFVTWGGVSIFCMLMLIYVKLPAATRDAPLKL